MMIDGVVAGVLVGWWMWLALRSTDKDWGYVGKPYPRHVILMRRMQELMEDATCQIGEAMLPAVRAAAASFERLNEAWGNLTAAAGDALEERT